MQAPVFLCAEFNHSEKFKKLRHFDSTLHANVIPSHRKANCPAVFFYCAVLYVKSDTEKALNRAEHERGEHMEIEAKSVDRNLLLKLRGEIDHHGARTAMRDIERAIDTVLPKKLVLDFSGVTFMDSSGIALILRVQQRIQLLDGSLLVCNVPQQARRVLDAAGIGRLVPIR